MAVLAIKTPFWRPEIFPSVYIRGSGDGAQNGGDRSPKRELQCEQKAGLNSKRNLKPTDRVDESKRLTWIPDDPVGLSTSA